MENKVLVNISVPTLEKELELYLPANKTIGEIIYLIAKALTELSNGYYEYKNTEKLYAKNYNKVYDLNSILKDTDIRNGSELVFI